MANPSKHEYPIKVGRETYTLRFSNAGHREAEDFLGMDGDTLQMRVGQGRLGSRVLTALMWGGTRKYHRDDLRDVEAIDDLMDEITEQYEDDETGERARDGFVLPLMAAYLRKTPDELRRRMNGEEEEAPKDQDKPKGKPKIKAAS